MSWTEDMPIVSIKDVHKAFGELEVLKGVSLDVMKGEVICIIFSWSRYQGIPPTLDVMSGV